MRACEQLGSIIIVVWHHPTVRYKVSEGSAAARLAKCKNFFEHNWLLLALFEYRVLFRGDVI